MTLAALVGGWLGLAATRSAAGRVLGERLGARALVLFWFLATVGLVVLPFASAAVVFARGLAEVPSGPLVTRCGLLITLLVTKPSARPAAAAALALTVAGLLSLVIGFVFAWRSQRASRLVARSTERGVALLPTAEPVAFTAGLLRPRIVLSRGLLESLSEPHRSVVVAHEEAHRRGRHPLALFVVEALAKAMPLPPVRAAADACSYAMEALADDHAARTVGSRELVAEAVATAALARTGGVGFEGAEVERVRRLLSQQHPASGVLGALVAAAVLGLVAYAAAHALHCGAESISALAVKACRAV